ncbi:MAG: response regulator [Acidobacteria bacterium]|nr:response regulator [Acidobacteriota bacterium]
MRRVLIADDSTTIRKVVQSTLAATGWEILSAADGRQALEIARRAEPDVVLCDVLMPEMTGYEVAEALRPADPGGAPRILLLVGAFEPFDEERARACGAAGHMAKPFDPRKLRRRVEELLEQLPERVAPSAADVPVAEDEPLSVAAPAPAPPALPGPIPVSWPEALEAPVPVASVPLPGDEEFDLSPPASLAAGGPPPAAPGPAAPLDDLLREELRRRLEALAPDIVREVAWEVIPDILERLLREGAPSPASPPAGPGDRKP